MRISRRGGRQAHDCMRRLCVPMIKPCGRSDSRICVCVCVRTRNQPGNRRYEITVVYAVI